MKTQPKTPTCPAYATLAAAVRTNTYPRGAGACANCPEREGCLARAEGRKG